MTTLFTRYSRLSILALLLICAAGAGSLLTMGRQEDPTLVERYGLVLTPFPGAVAQRVEALVTEPLEARLLELGEVRQIISKTRAGLSIVNVELREQLTPAQVDQAWTLVRDQVELARQTFPAGVGATEVERQYVGAATMIIALSWADGAEAPLGVISRLAEDLQDRLQIMPDTEETQIFGESVEEIRVLADADALAALGLSAGDVAARISASDPKGPAGQVRADRLSLGVQVAGELDSVTRVREVPLLQQADGDAVRVGDIADVEKGVTTPPASIAVVDGSRTVLVGAYLRPNSRSDVWNAQARAIVETFRAELPAQITADIIFEQNAYVDDRLMGLAGTLGVSALIVFAVLFVMMGWRAALIVGAALPLTSLLVIFLIRLADQPLHQMSVTGLVIALGLLIDNAIVMVHEYRLRRGRGAAPLEAVDQAVRHLFAPLLASTLTTMLAFAPIALMPGSAGEFVGMIGVSVIFAVGSSLVLAMTIVPAFAAWFDGGSDALRKPGFLNQGLTIPPLTWAYRKVLAFIARVPIAGILLGLAAPIAGFYGASTLPMQFFPPTDRDMFQMAVTLPPEASIAETRRVTEEAEALLAEYPSVRHVGWVLGAQPPRTYYNVLADGNGQPNFAAGWVRTDSPQDTRRIVLDLAPKVRDLFPEAQFLVLPFEQGPPVNAPLEVRLFGPDFETLSALGDEIRLLLSQSRNVTFTNAQMKRGAPVARIQADPASAALAGLSLRDIAGLVRSDLDGAVGGSILEGAEELPVRVLLDDGARSNLDAVRGKAAPGARPGELGAPVSALGDVTLEPEMAVITRIDAQRVNRIYGYVSPFTLPDVALTDFRERLAQSDVEIPAGYRLEFGGEANASGDALGILFATAGPLIILMMGALVLAFNSFRYAGVVALVGVLSVGLAFLGVWMFGQPNGFNAIIGAMGLVGLAVNGAIVVLSALKANPQAVTGDVEAIVETTVDASRHIISTTLTTIGGFVPLILAGDSFWLPLATAIAGGVAGSAVLALFFAPAAFSMMAKGRQRRARKRSAKQAALAGAPAE